MPDPAPPTTPSAEVSRFAEALAGQYVLEREIGRGGMGIVYLARDVKLDRLVAIKTLPPHLAADPIIRQRFLREARTAGGLSHPNIVPVHRSDELQGQVFFVMGYVEGSSMAQRIRERGRIHAPEVVHELRDIAEALGYAHSRGVIHRDVKAENILVDGLTGHAMVTDFGIARMAEAAPLTSTGQILGTVYYLSPEQVTGDGVDARSDIYAVGVVGYFALSGRFPFNAELASAVLVAHVTKTPPPLHEIAPHTPRVLTDIIEKCMAKDPTDRFQDCFELRDALSAIENLVLAEVGERAANSEPLAQQALLSNTEAQDILSRAADLQAATGVQPRQAPVIGSRDAQREISLTSGHRLGNVRDAAIEAGISSKYVDHALLERGLTPLGDPAETPISVIDRGKPSLLAGGRVNIEYEIVVNGEMPAEDFDLLADIIRRAGHQNGQVAAVGRSFSWQGYAAKSYLNVSVLPRHGRTSIRVTDSLKATVGGIFGGVVGGVGGSSFGPWMVFANHHANSVGLGALMWVGTVGLTLVGARGIFGVVSRRCQRLLRQLAESLAVQARESITAATPKVSHGTPPRLRG